MNGDQALFTRSDGIERLWEISAPLLDTAAGRALRAGVLGTMEVDDLLKPFHWHLS